MMELAQIRELVMTQKENVGSQPLSFAFENRPSLIFQVHVLSNAFKINTAVWMGLTTMLLQVSTEGYDCLH